MNYLIQSQLHVQATLKRTSFDGFDKKSIKTARDFLKDFKDFFFIYGDVGVGKTQFLADMIREFIMTREPYVKKVKNGSIDGKINWDEKWTFHQVAFIKEAEFFNFLKSLWQYGENKLELDKIEKYKQVDLFFIDDMGVKGEAPWIYERYYQIIDYRYCNHLPTVVTSNLNHDDLKEIEPRVASRVCSGLYLELKGKDRRL